MMKPGMIKPLCTLAIFVLFGWMAAAQSLYRLDSIQEIRIYFAEADWDARLDSLKKNTPDERLVAPYAMLNGVRFDSVGVRYKGNSSYSPTRNKNPFNIKLDHVIDGQHYEGFKILKLSNGFMDPSFLREVLGYFICRQYLPASRANFMRVYVNDAYIGLYTNVEHAGDGFLEANYLSSSGAYFQCDRADVPVSIPPSCTPANPGSALRYTSPDSACYYNQYELESEHGWASLLNLLKMLNQSPATIAEVLNVDRALWMLALNNAYVNLDSYSGSGHNYLIYQMANGRYQCLPWDLNEFYGAFTNAGTGGSLNVQQMRELDPLLHLNNPDRPLVSKLLLQPAYQRRYLAHLQTIFDDLAASGHYDSLGSSLQALIRQDVERDVNKFFSLDAFNQNLRMDFRIGGGGGKTYPGLTKFSAERLAFTTAHPRLQYVRPAIGSPAHSPDTVSATGGVAIAAEVFDATTIQLFYRYDPAEVFVALPMFDDGQHGDGAAGDHRFGTIVPMNGRSLLQYYLYAENEQLASLSPPRAEFEFHQLVSGSTKPRKGALRINEILASNVTGTTDESGDREDWIELYNTTDETIPLSGLFLSDNPSNPLKWSFPDTTLGARGFLIIWADEDGKDPGLHANFKLSKSGEQVMLYYADTALLDELVFPELADDESFGYCASGNQIFRQPSFMQTNDCIVLTDDLTGSMPIEFFPNPCQSTGTLLVRGEGPVRWGLYDLRGRILIRGEMAAGSGTRRETLDCSQLSPGIYLLRVDTPQRNAQLKIFRSGQ